MKPHSLTRNINERQPANWQRELSQSFTRLNDLLTYLELTPETMPTVLRQTGTFPIRVPKAFAQRIRKGDPHDPLLLQVLPDIDERTHTPGFTHNPVGDLESQVSGGLLHKYHGRVLLITTQACAIHCRYCFRQHFPYSESSVTGQQWQNALAYIKKTPSIEEVILSGGDPLNLSDDKLAAWVRQLESIPHLQRLRLHSRTATVVPNRITDALCKILNDTRLHAVLVTHVNHPQEIDLAVVNALHTLKQHDISLLNQTVLLKSINDQVDTLSKLSKKLFEVGILPYYLHTLDPVSGASRYSVSVSRSKTLFSELQSQLPGYLVPRLVTELVGQSHKTLL